MTLTPDTYWQARNKAWNAYLDRRDAERTEELAREAGAFTATDRARRRGIPSASGGRVNTPRKGAE